MKQSFNVWYVQNAAEAVAHAEADLTAAIAANESNEAVITAVRKIQNARAECDRRVRTAKQYDDEDALLAYYARGMNDAIEHLKHCCTVENGGITWAAAQVMKTTQAYSRMMRVVARYKEEIMNG